MKHCVYTVFNRTFLNREIKSHISEMENVNVGATLLTHVNVSRRLEITDLPTIYSIQSVDVNDVSVIIQPN